MTHASATDRPHQPTEPAGGRPRYRLTPSGPPAGRYDGGWWPRSRDLAAELPDLLSAVAQDLGEVEQVTYHLGDWDEPIGRRIRHSNGANVRLGGYQFQHAGTVDLISARRLVTLAVVPPPTPARMARCTLDAAATPGDDTHIDDMLGAQAQSHHDKEL